MPRVHNEKILEPNIYICQILKQSVVRAGTASIVGLEEVDLADVLDHGQLGDLEPGLDPNRRPPGFLVLAQRGKLQLWQPDKPATEVSNY